MKNLNWNKVGKMLWIDLTMCRKRILILCLIVMGATFALLTYGSINGTTLDTVPSEVQKMLPLDFHALQVATIVGNSEFVVVIASLVVFSGIFSIIEKQSDEIRYLMLPASVQEKWVSRVAYVVIVGYVFVHLSFLLGLFAWCGAASLLGSDLPQMVLRTVFHPLTMFNEIGMVVSPTMYISGFGMSFLVYTFYIMCGTYYRHTPWLYTLLWGIGTYIVFVISMGIVTALSINNNWWNLKEIFDGGHFNFDFTPYTPFVVVCGCVSVLLGLLFLWFSFRHFSRRQLENKRVFTV